MLKEVPFGVVSLFGKYLAALKFVSDLDRVLATPGPMKKIHIMHVQE